MDTRVALTYFIRLGWIKNLTISTLVFNITQFFPSFNHQILFLILEKAGFDIKVSNFFKNYLIGRKTTYLWNDFSSPLHNIDVGIGQSSALSSILLALYLSPIFYILEKQLKNLKFQFPFCFLLTMYFLFLRISLFMYQMLISFVVTILFLIFWPSSVLSWNMEKLKYFTFLDSEENLTSLQWILLRLEILSFILINPDDI